MLKELEGIKTWNNKNLKARAYKNQMNYLFYREHFGRRDQLISQTK